MNGREVFRHAVQKISGVIEETLVMTGYAPDEIDLYVPHQANKRILDGIAKRLGIDPEQDRLHARQARQHLGGLDPARPQSGLRGPPPRGGPAGADGGHGRRLDLGCGAGAVVKSTALDLCVQFQLVVVDPRKCRQLASLPVGMLGRGGIPWVAKRSRVQILRKRWSRRSDYPVTSPRSWSSSSCRRFRRVWRQGEPCKLSSFGSFGIRQKGQRVGRNPKTGQEVPITPRRVLVFRPSNIMKDRINAWPATRRNAAE